MSIERALVALGGAVSDATGQREAVVVTLATAAYEALKAEMAAKDVELLGVALDHRDERTGELTLLGRATVVVRHARQP